MVLTPDKKVFSVKSPLLIKCYFFQTSAPDKTFILPRLASEKMLCLARAIPDKTFIFAKPLVLLIFFHLKIIIISPKVLNVRYWI